MSTSQWLGNLTVPGNSVLYFNTVITPEGGIPDVPLMLSEELRDKGVDFLRWREESMQFPEFTMDTTADYTTDRGGRDLQRSYWKANDKFCALRVMRATNNLYVYRDVKITGVFAQIVAGGSFGHGAQSGSIGTIFARWTMRITRITVT